MSRNLLKLYALACASLCILGCDESDQNSAECNPASYKAECVKQDSGTDLLKTCSEDGTIKAVECGANEKCVSIENGAQCKPNSASSCGNDKIDAGEQCDGKDLGGAKCPDGKTGTVSCNKDCTLNTSLCADENKCGNDTIDAGEQCDGNDLGGAKCPDGKTGTVSCNKDCTLNTSLCADENKCGNNTIDAGEQCDGNDLGGAKCPDGKTGTVSCNKDCTLNTSLCTDELPAVTCNNDGVLDEGEECDGLLIRSGKGCPGGKTGAVCTDKCAVDVSKCTTLPKANDDCDPEAFVPQCDGQTLLKCDKNTATGANYVGIVECDKLPDTSCIDVLDGDKVTAGCYSIKDKCEDGDDKGRICISSKVSSSYKCSQASDGNYYKLASSEDLHQCGGEGFEKMPDCLNTTNDCGKLHEESGTECDVEKYADKCDEKGNLVLSCQKSTVQATECQEGTKCINTQDNSPVCSEVCTEEGAVKYACEDYKMFGATLYRTAPYKCTKLESGLFFVRDEDGVMNCEHGCATEDYSCKMLSEKEKTVCDLTNEKEKSICDGSIALNCSNLEGQSLYKATDCKAKGDDYICNGGTCVQSCTEIGKETYKCSTGFVSYSYKYVCEQSSDNNILVQKEKTKCTSKCIEDTGKCPE